MARLEAHYGDMQDIEFTIEQGRLYLLQTRNGKRTAQAAVRVACDMVDEGVITKEAGVQRIDPRQLDQLLHPTIDPDAPRELIATGLNASPGAGVGEIVLDADLAEQRGKAGHPVILVRWETTPDDIHGLIHARGVLTAHGGMTSHAAVVARGMGKPCVAGCEGLTIELDDGIVRVGGNELRAGDVITTVNNQTVDGPRDLARRIAGFGPKTRVEIGYVRDGAAKTVSVQLGTLAAGFHDMLNG